MPRVQVVVPRELHETLLEMSRASGRPISQLGREALARLAEDWRRRRRREALAEVLALEGPTGPWEELERELEEGPGDALP